MQVLSDQQYVSQCVRTSQVNGVENIAVAQLIFLNKQTNKQTGGCCGNRSESHATASTASCCLSDVEIHNNFLPVSAGVLTT